VTRACALLALALAVGCSSGGARSVAAIDAPAFDAGRDGGAASDLREGGPGDGGAACGDRSCGEGELCRVLYLGGGTPGSNATSPSYQCVAIPAACRGAARPTCACDGAKVGYCSQPEGCQCADATPFALTCTCGGA
jgi:hypothetical protein